MTSKEALKDIFMEALLLDKEKRAITNVELFERKEQIEKDLEILDTLKKYIRAGHWSNEYTLLSWEMKSRELKKIKEWCNERN